MSTPSAPSTPCTLSGGLVVDPPGGLVARPVLLLLWLGSLALLLIAPGAVPVSRTQEARVLETARQMFDQFQRPSDFLVPHLNGQPRLQKPPLAYWLSIASYKVFGVSAGAGRLPAVLAGWGTLTFTYLAGTRFFNRRTGLLAAACLLSSYLFYRYTRLAETDTLSTVFVTASCYFFWRASMEKGDGSHFRAVVLFHLGAACAAGAALSKGPPVAYSILFFFSLALIERNRVALRRFLTSGCLLTLVVIAGAWYGYLASQHLLGQVFSEIDDLRTGRDHGGTFLNYLPELLTSTAPWSGFLVAALVFSIQRWRTDPRLRRLLLWSAAIFLPLCVVGNKQFHYLFPLMPPLMLLVAALLDHVLSLSPGDRALRPINAIFLGTLAVTAAGAVALPLTSHAMTGRFDAVDFVLMTAIAGAAAAAFSVHFRRGLHASIPGYVRAAVVVMPLILSLWLPRLVTDDFSSFAQGLNARFGPSASYTYYQFPKLPLNFNLRKPTPYATKPGELRDLMSNSPESILLISTKRGESPPLPKNFPVDLVDTLHGREQDLHAYRVRSSRQ